MPNTPQSLAEQLYEKNLDLLYERRRMEQLLYSVSEAVAVLDKDYKFTVFNNVAERLTEKKSDEVLGKDIDDVLILVDKENHKFAVKDFCFKDELVNVPNLALISGTKKYYVTFKSITVINEDKAKECLITITDVTKEKQLEQAKDDFISVASHELRTPMTIIKSYLWMLTSGKTGGLAEKQMEYLAKASSATQRMIDLINDMLSISRYEQGRVEFEIKKLELVQNAVEYLTDLGIKAQERGIYLNVNTGNKTYEVFADHKKVGEIFTNLAGNAIKFTRQGGITVTFEEDENFVKTLITDTGAGISEEDQKHLFHKFGRLDNSYQTVAETGGTGLGLYIVKIYVEGMGGKVGASSGGQGKGSTFWFTLPKNKPQEKKTTTFVTLETPPQTIES